DEMITAVTRGLVGDAQIHARGYQDAPELDAVVPAPAIVDTMLAAFVPSARAEHRVIGAGLASSGEESTAALVMGIEPTSPDAQALVAITSGRKLGVLPSGGDVSREAVIGSGLANQLGVGVGGELVLVSQAADGSLANEHYTVVGIGDAGSAEANAS